MNKLGKRRRIGNEKSAADGAHRLQLLLMEAGCGAGLLLLKRNREEKGKNLV
jgi:hypothetical protein